jgi:hypothetical protein
MRSSSPAWLSLLVGFTLPCGGCAETRSVALLSTAGVPVTATPSGDIPLEVVTRGTAVADPLPVRGTSIAYSDVEAALGLAVSTAGAYWAAAHRTSRADGFQLLVELTRAEAEQRGDRLVVSLDARAPSWPRRRRTASRGGSWTRREGGPWSTPA